MISRKDDKNGRIKPHFTGPQTKSILLDKKDQIQPKKRRLISDQIEQLPNEEFKREEVPPQARNKRQISESSWVEIIDLDGV